MKQVDSNVCIVHAPPNETHPFGAATLWPCHRFGEHLWARALVPGCAVVAVLHTSDGPIMVVLVYAPSQKQDTTADALRRYLAKWCKEDIVIVGGDFEFNNGGSAYQEAIHVTMTSNGLRPAICQNLYQEICRTGTTHSYLDDGFDRYPSTRDEADVQPELFLPARQINEHAKMSIKLRSTSYPDIDDYKQFEHSRSDRIHPATADAHDLFNRLAENMVRLHPIQAREQIRATVAAANMSHAHKQLPNSAQARYRNHESWKNLRRICRNSTDEILLVKAKAVHNLSDKIAKLTCTDGMHDLVTIPAVMLNPAAPHGATGACAGNRQSGIDEPVKVGGRMDELITKLGLLDSLIACKRFVTKYIFRRTSSIHLKPAMNRLQEKLGRFGKQLHMLYKREFAPDGPHSHHPRLHSASSNKQFAPIVPMS